jgi:hypothetical protein
MFRPYRPDDTVLEIGWGPTSSRYFDHWDAGEEFPGLGPRRSV